MVILPAGYFLKYYYLNCSSVSFSALFTVNHYIHYKKKIITQTVVLTPTTVFYFRLALRSRGRSYAEVHEMENSELSVVVNAEHKASLHGRISDDFQMLSALDESSE